MRDLPIFRTLESPATVIAGDSVSSRYLKLRLSCLNPNPIGNLILNLRITGTPPTPTLLLKSTPQSELYYEQLVPKSAFAREINWSIPVKVGYTGIIYVTCGDVRSNSVIFKQLNL